MSFSASVIALRTSKASPVHRVSSAPCARATDAVRKKRRRPRPPSPTARRMPSTFVLTSRSVRKVLCSATSSPAVTSHEWKPRTANLPLCRLRSVEIPHRLGLLRSTEQSTLAHLVSLSLDDAGFRNQSQIPTHALRTAADSNPHKERRSDRSNNDQSERRSYFIRRRERGISLRGSKKVCASCSTCSSIA